MIKSVEDILTDLPEGQAVDIDFEKIQESMRHDGIRDFTIKNMQKWASAVAKKHKMLIDVNNYNYISFVREEDLKEIKEKP